MSRLFRILSALPVLLLLTACSKTTPPVDISVEAPQDAQNLAVFAGVYRDLVPDEGDEAYVQITTCPGFLMLEHFLCMDGSVYSFWAEEFWPYEEGLTEGDFTSVCGQSRTFSLMTSGDYDTSPQKRAISLTEEGVVLNYDDSDAEYYVKDLSFSYHTTHEQLRQILGDGTAKADKELFGTWSWRSSREAVCLTFQDDGSVFFLQKKEGEPAQVYEGVFAFEKGRSVKVVAEKIGDGLYPHIMSWEWLVDRDDMLWLTFEDSRQIIFLPTEGAAIAPIDGKNALISSQ